MKLHQLDQTTAINLKQVAYLRVDENDGDAFLTMVDGYMFALTKTQSRLFLMQTDLQLKLTKDKKYILVQKD